MAWALRILVVAAAAFAVYRFVLTRDEAPAPRKDARAPAEQEMLGPWPRSQFYIEHDRFLPATDPRMLPAAEASWLRDTDEVYGVVVKGEARAYSIPMISYHHVVNDVIQGIPVAVTY